MRSSVHRHGLACGLLCLLLLASAGSSKSQEAAKRAITFDDLIAMHRVAEAQLSPNGKWVAYMVATPDLEANRNATNLWMAPVAGGEAIQLTRTGKDSSPQWSPDGKSIAFLSARSGDSQVYLLSMDGGEAHPLTKLSTGADFVKWSPDGKTIAFTSSVFPDCRDDGCNKKRNDEKEKNKVKAHVAENLLYRHWTHWNDGPRAHLFVMPADGNGEAKDLTAGANYDVPPDQRGDENDVNFSPDSKEICFAAVTDKVEATSTNGDLFTVPVTGDGEPKRITTQPGFDGNPVYSPDGKFIAYHAQLTARYEADKWRVMLYERATGKNENLSEGFDRSATNLAWSPDSKTIYFLAENETEQPVYAMTPAAGATARKIVNGFNAGFGLSKDGKTMWSNAWGYRWNAQVFSGAGYVTLMINRRGSTGYGQKFTDEITNDWGGKAYLDVMNGVDYALKKYSFVDGTRMAAAGGSYGGYMADWIATHNGRFKAIVSHASVYDKVSMYATEELWFEEHDMQGTPWTNPESYRKWGPVTYAGELGKYKTPTLVIAGEKDYRVPYTQSLEFFSALQRQGVPSKLIVFPDEGHWVLKPQNSQFWYKTFLDWLAAYVK